MQRINNLYKKFISCQMHVIDVDSKRSNFFLPNIFQEFNLFWVHICIQTYTYNIRIRAYQLSKYLMSFRKCHNERKFKLISILFHSVTTQKRLHLSFQYFFFSSFSYFYFILMSLADWQRLSIEDEDDWWPHRCTQMRVPWKDASHPNTIWFKPISFLQIVFLPEKVEKRITKIRFNLKWS